MKYMKFNELRWKINELNLLRFESEMTKNYFFQIWSPIFQEPDEKKNVERKY